MTSTTTIRLYNNKPEPGTSPYAQRVQIALAEKNIRYEITYIDLLNKPPEFVDLFRNIVGNAALPASKATVPVLQVGGTHLAESEVIVEYLDNAYPDSGTKLLPADPFKLALVRLFVNSYKETVVPYIFKLLGSETSQANAEALQSFIQGLKVIDEFLRTHGDKTGSFLLGQEFSWAEIAVLPLLIRAQFWLKEYRNIDVKDLINDNGLTHLEQWSQAGLDRPSVRETTTAKEIVVPRAKRFVKVALKDLN